jgi:uridine phosphorylase
MASIAGRSLESPREREEPVAAPQYHLKISDGDVAPYVLLPGDPGRVETIAAMWDTARHVATNREYVTYTGTFRGAPISCVSTGIGAPSTSIAMEELARCGADTFLRVGTCGTVQSDLPNGTVAIFDSAMRLDGSSRAYAPIEFPAVASYDVVAACAAAAAELSVASVIGTTRSADTFYAGHPRPGSSFGGYWQSAWREHFEDLRRLNVVAAEMEASVIFVLARVWGLRADGMAVILDNVLEVSDDAGVFDPRDQLDHSAEHIDRVCRVANEAVRRLWEADQNA